MANYMCVYIVAYARVAWGAMGGRDGARSGRGCGTHRWAGVGDGRGVNASSKVR